MAKAVRGLPEGFELNIPDEPVRIGDFLDEEPPVLPVKRPAQKVLPQAVVDRFVPASEVQPRIVRDEVGERPPSRASTKASQRNVVRFQLSLTPSSKAMLEQVVEHVRMYSPQTDASVSEVFEGIMQLLHNAM